MLVGAFAGRGGGRRQHQHRGLQQPQQGRRRRTADVDHPRRGRARHAAQAPGRALGRARVAFGLGHRALHAQRAREQGGQAAGLAGADDAGHRAFVARPRPRAQRQHRPGHVVHLQQRGAAVQVRRGIAAQDGGGRPQRALQRAHQRAAAAARGVFHAQHVAALRRQARRHARGAPTRRRRHDPPAAGGLRQFLGAPLPAGDGVVVGRRLARHQQPVVADEAGQVVLHVVDAHAERVVPDEEGAGHGGRAPEVHRQLGPEHAVEQVVRAEVQRAMELVQVHLVQQVAQFGQLLQPFEHLARGQHQLQQRGEGGLAVEHEVQVAGDVLDAEAEVLLAWPPARQLVHAVAQPVVVRLPVLAGDEVLEGALHDEQPAGVARQRVQPHQAEGGLAVVVDDARGLLDRQVVRVQHVDEAAAGAVLHEADALRQPLHQRQPLAAAGGLGVLGQRQQADGAAAQLDLVGHVHQEGGVGAVGQHALADELPAHEGQAALDGLHQRRIARELPGLQHRVERAGVAQRVVAGDAAVEAGEQAVDELAAGLHLPRQVPAAAGHQRQRAAGGERRHLAAAGVQPGAGQPVHHAVVLAEHAGGGEQVDLARGVEVGRGLVREARAQVDLEVVLVELRARHLRAGVEHGVGVELLLGQQAVEAGVQRQAEPEVVALDVLQVGLELAPGQLAHALHPVHPQPGRGQGARAGVLQHLAGAFGPGVVEAVAAHVRDAGAALAVGHREDQRERRKGRRHLRADGGDALAAGLQHLLQVQRRPLGAVVGPAFRQVVQGGRRWQGGHGPRRPQR